jgi:hypothetical protein
MFTARRHPRRSVRPSVGMATAVLALVLVAPAAGALDRPPPPITNVPPGTRVVPPVASVTISPGSGLAGTAISVQLIVTPGGSCGMPAIALRTAPGLSSHIALDLNLSAPAPGAPYAGTLVVPALTAPGTVLYVDGGCAGTAVISPAVPFVVTAPNVVATPVVVPPPPRR